MKCVGFLILFVINCFGLSCEGQVIPQSKVTRGIPGSTVKLNWTYPGNSSKATLQWTFTRRGGTGSKEEEIAKKNKTHPVEIPTSSLPGVRVELPGTLVLENVDERYNGKYLFDVQVADDGGDADVELYIAVKPNVTINCSSYIILNEGDNFTCLCRSEGGNPPTDVTWFRNGTQFGETRTESNTLTRTNVNETDNATYTCFAQSYSKHAMFNDSKPVVVQVKFKPKDTFIEFTQNPAKLGKSVTIRCKSLGFPEPSYTIILNDTTTVSTEMTYTIPMVGWNDTGTYNCTAKSERGSDWAADFLNVTVSTTDEGEGKGGRSTSAIVIGIVISIAGLIVLLVIVGVVARCRRKGKCKQTSHETIDGYELAVLSDKKD